MKRNQTLNKSKDRIKEAANQKVVPEKSEVEEIPKRFRPTILTGQWPALAKVGSGVVLGGVGLFHFILDS